MAPTQFCTKCVQNLLIREYLRKPHHLGQISCRESRTEFFHQFCRHCRQNLLPILRPFFLEDVLPDALPDTPIKQDQRGVHLPRRFNQLSQIFKYSFRCDCFHSSPLLCPSVFSMLYPTTFRKGKEGIIFFISSPLSINLTSVSYFNNQNFMTLTID